jgi:hypothetical protein
MKLKNSKTVISRTKARKIFRAHAIQDFGLVWTCSGDEDRDEAYKALSLETIRNLELLSLLSKDKGVADDASRCIELLSRLI